MTTTPKSGRIAVPGGEVWYSIRGHGRGVPLLVLHGGPGLPHDYLEPLADLSDERPVVFFDQLGCGRSSRPKDPALWNLERFVEELGIVRNALGLERVHVLGHSWGTMLASEYLLSVRPADIASLVMASPVLSVPIHVARSWTLRRQLPSPIQSVLDRHEAAGTTESPEYRLAVLEFRLRHFCRQDPWPAVLLRAYEGMSRDVNETMLGPSAFSIGGNLKAFDQSSRLHELRYPVLLTCGRYDESHPDDVKIYCERIPGASMVVFEGSAHVPHIEERTLFMKTVREFLRSAEAQGR